MMYDASSREPSLYILNRNERKKFQIFGDICKIMNLHRSFIAASEKISRFYLEFLRRLDGHLKELVQEFCIHLNQISEGFGFSPCFCLQNLTVI